MSLTAHANSVLSLAGARLEFGQSPSQASTQPTVETSCSVLKEISWRLSTSCGALSLIHSAPAPALPETGPPWPAVTSTNSSTTKTSTMKTSTMNTKDTTATQAATTTTASTPSASHRHRATKVQQAAPTAIRVLRQRSRAATAMAPGCSTPGEATRSVSGTWTIWMMRCRSTSTHSRLVWQQQPGEGPVVAHVKVKCMPLIARTAGACQQQGESQNVTVQEEGFEHSMTEKHQHCYPHSCRAVQTSCSTQPRPRMTCSHVQMCDPAAVACIHP